MVHLTKADLERARAQARLTRDAGLAAALLALALAASPLLGQGPFGYAFGIVGVVLSGALGLGLAQMTNRDHPAAGLLRAVALYAGGLAVLAMFFLGPPLTGFALVVPGALASFLAVRGSRHAPTLALLLAPVAFAFAAWWTRAGTEGAALWGAALAALALLGSEVQRLGQTGVALLAEARPHAGEADAPEGVATASWLAGTLVGRALHATVWTGVAFVVGGLFILNRDALLAVDVLAPLDVAVAAAVLVAAGAGLAYLTVRKRAVDATPAQWSPGAGMPPGNG